MTTLNLAARQSVIDGKPRGMDVSIGRIEILKYDGEWSADYQRDLDTAYGLELRIEDQLVDLKARDKTKEKKTQPPLIIFDATGNVTPFSLEISGANDNFILTPNARGQFQIETAS